MTLHVVAIVVCLITLSTAIPVPERFDPNDPDNAELLDILNKLKGALVRDRAESAEARDPDLQQRSEPRFQLDNDGDTYDVDVETNKQVIWVNAGDDRGTKVVIDGARGLISWFSPVADECYLIGGIDGSIVESDERRTLGAPRTLYFVKADDKPITDPAILSPEVRNQCRDLGVFWLERFNTDVTFPGQQVVDQRDTIPGIRQTCVQQRARLCIFLPYVRAP